MTLESVTKPRSAVITPSIPVGPAYPTAEALISEVGVPPRRQISNSVYGTQMPLRADVLTIIEIVRHALATTGLLPATTSPQLQERPVSGANSSGSSHLDLRA